MVSLMSNKRKILMVISSEKKSKWLRTKIDQLSSEFDKVIIVNERGISNDFEAIGNLQIENLEDFIAKEITNQERKFQIDFINNISMKLLSSNQIKKEFILDNVNTWWFLPNKIFSQIRNHNFIAAVSAITNLIEKFNSSLVIFDSDYKHSDILRKICEKKLLPYKTQNVFHKKISQKISRLLKYFWIFT